MLVITRQGVIYDSVRLHCLWDVTTAASRSCCSSCCTAVGPSSPPSHFAIGKLPNSMISALQAQENTVARHALCSSSAIAPPRPMDHRISLELKIYFKASPSPGHATQLYPAFTHALIRTPLAMEQDPNYPTRDLIACMLFAP